MGSFSCFNAVKKCVATTLDPLEKLDNHKKSEEQQKMF